MESKLVILFAALFISGCAHMEKKECPICVPGEPKTVYVPVPIPCKTETPVKPDYNFPKVQPELDIYEKTKILIADIKLHLAYEEELEAAFKSCK